MPFNAVRGEEGRGKDWALQSEGVGERSGMREMCQSLNMGFVQRTILEVFVLE